MPSHVSPLVSALEYLQPRDRILLRLLSAHQVLTTDQIRALLFGSRRVCQRRLQRLHAIRLLDRFRQRGRGGAPLATRWTLGPLGLRFLAAAGGHAAPRDRAIRERLERLAASSQLAHRLGTHQFFVDLAAHAHRHPATRLVRWWSGPRAASLLHRVVPDGHGIWHADGASVSWFFEYDTGTEDLPRLVGKIAAYEKAARVGAPAWPVLLWLPNPRREANLHRLLAGATGRCPVATAAGDTGTAGVPGPAGPVWWPVGVDGPRRHLQEIAPTAEPLPEGDWRDEYTIAGDEQ